MTEFIGNLAHARRGVPAHTQGGTPQTQIVEDTPEKEPVLETLVDIKRSLHNLEYLYHSSSHNFEDEPGAATSAYAPVRSSIANPLLYELALAGYAFGVQFPISGALSTSNGIQYSVFNRGSKTVLVTNIDCMNVGSNPTQYFLTTTQSDPLYANQWLSQNRKVAILSGATSINTTFSNIGALTTPTNFVDFNINPGNAISQMFSTDFIYVLPAGRPSGLVVTVLAQTGTPNASTHFHLVELPY